MEKIVRALARIIMIMTLVVMTIAMTQEQIFADEGETAADIGAIGSGDMSAGEESEGSVVDEEPTEEPETPGEGDMVSSTGTESSSTPSAENPENN